MPGNAQYKTSTYDPDPLSPEHLERINTPGLGEEGEAPSGHVPTSVSSTGDLAIEGT